jgi:hypothetical protein
LETLISLDTLTRFEHWEATMRRREFIAALGSAVAVPFDLKAQQPETVTVERIEVARPGVYEIQARGSSQDLQANQSISTGQKTLVRAYKHLRTGTQIEAKTGTVIGAELTIIGAPRRGKVPIKVIWRYPQPGVINPETKAPTTVDEYPDSQLVGERFPVFWSLSQEWHLVPGTWTLEVWHGERKLVDQRFQVGSK